MNFLVVLAVVLAAVLAERTSYQDYKVYQVIPKTIQQLEALNEYEDNDSYDFWTKPRALDNPIHIMVAPGAQKEFIRALAFFETHYSILIEDVEETITAERARQFQISRLNDDRISFTQYHRHSAIQSYLAQLAKNYPDVVSLENIGASTEGRNLTIIKIGAGGVNKPVILVDGGIHAREWISPAVVLYIIQQLVENSANRPLIETTSWYIIPVLNPDGYEYTHTNDRMWRKTRSRQGLLCTGVDPNRNFDFHWMENGASSNPCAETFGGPKGFSEPETAALRDLVLKYKDNLKLYLTFHSYGKYLLYPWGYTAELPSDAPELHALAENVNTAIKSVAGTSYTIGSSTNVLYAAAGGSDDWLKGVGAVQLSYTIELPGGGQTGFDLPASKINDVCAETWKGVVVYQNYIEKKFANLV